MSNERPGRAGSLVSGAGGVGVGKRCSGAALPNRANGEPRHTNLSGKIIAGTTFAGAHAQLRHNENAHVQPTSTRSAFNERTNGPTINVASAVCRVLRARASRAVAWCAGRKISSAACRPGMRCVYKVRQAYVLCCVAVVGRWWRGARTQRVLPRRQWGRNRRWRGEILCRQVVLE